MARRHSKSVLLPCLLCVLITSYVGLSRWRKHWLFQVQVNELQYRGYNSLAERFTSTPYENSRWAKWLLNDFGCMDCYASANRALPPPSPDRVVLYGDSVTEYWVTRAPQTFFPGRGYIGRGVGGQTTPQLLWRFQQDVLQLKPHTLVLQGGTNDIVLSGRAISDGETRDNLRRMIAMAQSERIQVILCSLLPVSYAEQPRQRRSTMKIKALNAWLRDYATSNHLRYVDYFSAMADSRDSLPPALSPDGLHPNVAGYRIMQWLLQPMLDEHPAQ